MLRITLEDGEWASIGDALIFADPDPSAMGRVRLSIDAPRSIQINREKGFTQAQKEKVEEFRSKGGGPDVDKYRKVRTTYRLLAEVVKYTDALQETDQAGVVLKQLEKYLVARDPRFSLP